MAERTQAISGELVLKMARCLIHCSDYLSEDGEAEDLAAAITLWTDPELIAWLARMHELGLLPIKRRPHVSR